ncbi:hypothetical protein EIN_182510 [Entamoeba invadens IP1]|uniref:hypothetical protein n=1 Tax=Entamoeba invadens IP1 TaxID=370355 RepID=UPI0002C3F5A7|nr:hypothetical protein EIN_182510 [Entamoeba invadens IP1]ELP94024.1 hypothetical protein EIN_182510 [Entamoeba invadens IP1]|eukprot:XP_004260795.1 hypothetical protein EIN_182510 [Entamoeba invadens IP1]
MNEWRKAAELFSTHYCGMSLNEALLDLKKYFVTQMKMGELTDFMCETMMTLDQAREFRDVVEIAIGKELQNKVNAISNMVKIIEFYSIDVNKAKAKSLEFYFDFLVKTDDIRQLFQDVGMAEWAVRKAGEEDCAEMRSGGTMIVFRDYFKNVFGIHLPVGVCEEEQHISLFSLRNNNNTGYLFLTPKKDVKLARVVDGAFWTYCIDDVLYLRTTRPFAVCFKNINKVFNDTSGLNESLCMGTSEGMLKDIVLFESNQK